MRKILIPALSAAFALSGCMSAYTGPVEVTRFVSADRTGLEAGSVAMALPDGGPGDGIYAEAVAAELAQLGYAIAPGDASELVAEVRVERVRLDEGRRRSPVSVGVGGSTGSYGSGVGAGLGISLGGTEQPTMATELRVVLRRTDATAPGNVWEGRAELLTSDNSDYAEPAAAAEALASALLRDFPGESGETIRVEID